MHKRLRGRNSELRRSLLPVTAPLSPGQKSLKSTPSYLILLVLSQNLVISNESSDEINVSYIPSSRFMILFIKPKTHDQETNFISRLKDHVINKPVLRPMTNANYSFASFMRERK